MKQLFQAHETVRNRHFAMRIRPDSFNFQANKSNHLPIVYSMKGNLRESRSFPFAYPPLQDAKKEAALLAQPHETFLSRKPDSNRRPIHYE